MEAPVGSRTSRFTSAYYVGNALVLSSYVFLRPLAVSASHVGTQSMLKSYEGQATAMLLFSCCLKATRTHSVDQQLSIVFLYAKAGLLLVSYLASPLMLALALFQVVCLWLLTTQPMYDGPTKAEALTPALMETLVSAAPATGEASPLWVVMLYAPWSTPCVHFSPAFAGLSRAHSCDKLRFGTLDLGRWPGLAGRYGVDMNAAASQLPMLLLYRGGVEADRMPRRSADGMRTAKGRWGVRDVESCFKLHELATGSAEGEKHK